MLRLIFNFLFIITVFISLGDSLDGDDIVAVCEDLKECRFYLPEFKERSRFKSLVKADSEESHQVI